MRRRSWTERSRPSIRSWLAVRASSGISGVAASTTDSGRLILTRLSSLPSCTLMCSQRFVFASAAAAPIKSRAMPITRFPVSAVSLAPASRRCYWKERAPGRGSFIAAWGARSSGGLGEAVLELVGMLSVVDLDGQAAREARQLAGAGVRHHRDRQLRALGRHRAAVLQDEAAAAPLEGAADLLDRHVSARALGGAAGVEHLPLGGGLEGAVVLLVEGHPAEVRVGLEVRRQWGRLHIECSACMLLHGRLLPDRAGSRSMGLWRCRGCRSKGQAGSRRPDGDTSRDTAPSMLHLAPSSVLPRSGVVRPRLAASGPPSVTVRPAASRPCNRSAFGRRGIEETRHPDLDSPGAPPGHSRQ